MFLAHAAHILDTTPGELCALDLAHTAAQLEDGTIDPDVARQELQERQQLRDATTPTIRHVGVEHRHPGTIDLDIATHTTGQVSGVLRATIDFVGSTNHTYAELTAEDTTCFRTLTEVEDAIATLTHLRDAWRVTATGY